jgi:transposase
MRDTELYAQILGVRDPWTVTKVQLDMPLKRVEITIEHRAGTPLQCPECGATCSGYDARPRRWRHLDTCQFETVLVADVPRSDCAEHGPLQIPVPWADAGSRFTALFEALVIDWLHEASLSGVARQVGITWDEADGIQARAVRRGLARRKQKLPTRIGVDETSFQKRHEYVTVVIDQVAGNVVHVADDRKQTSLETYLASHPAEARAAVETVAMDMHQPYIRAVEATIPLAPLKICFDKFHVASHLGQAVDRVRREENRALRDEGDDRLKGTKYLWLTHPEHLSNKRWISFTALRESALKTARAWAIKELAMELWHYRSRSWALKAWKRWLGWAMRSRLAPVLRAARTIRNHLLGILNAMVHGITNARSEGVNAKIQWIKYTSRGFRNRERFRNAIYFHLGGLDLYPAGITR